MCQQPLCGLLPSHPPCLDKSWRAHGWCPDKAMGKAEQPYKHVMDPAIARPRRPTRLVSRPVTCIANSPCTGQEHTHVQGLCMQAMHRATSKHGTQAMRRATSTPNAQPMHMPLHRHQASTSNLGYVAQHLDHTTTTTPARPTKSCRAAKGPCHQHQATQGHHRSNYAKSHLGHSRPYFLISFHLCFDYKYGT